MKIQSNNIKIVLVLLLIGGPVCFAAQYEYDSLNRLVSVSYDDDTIVLYSYDASGNCHQKVMAAISDVDINDDGSVNLDDFAILARQWLLAPGEPTADIVPLGGDGTVDELDLAGMAEYWLHSFLPSEYSQDFSGGLPGVQDGWEYYSSDSGGRIEVVNERLRMDRDPSGTYTLNEAILHWDLVGASNVSLSFWQAESGDEQESLPANFTGHSDGDGVAVSSDGVNWTTVVNAADLDVGTTGQAFTIDLDTLGLEYTDDFQIKFQQYDNFPWDSDGREWDDISITFGP